MGEQQTCRSARYRKHNTFSKQLSSNTPAARAECGAHSHFLLAGSRAHEQKIGDISAGNQQDQRDGSQQNPQGTAHFANLVIEQELHPDPTVLV
jgi:hypothetical protein